MFKSLKITIIGAGKIANSIVPALLKNGFPVIQIISKSITSAKTLAKKNKIALYSNSLNELAEASNIIILAIPDGEINKTSLQLANTGISFKRKLVIHLSGSLTIAELFPLQKAGAYCASMHIMQTFPSKTITSIQNVFCAIESNNEKIKSFLTTLVLKLGMNPLTITSENKVFYHLAGVFASNFLNANFFAASSVFGKINADNDAYKKVLSTTSTTTLNNILSRGYAEALSGPVERGDLFTIKKHLKALKKNKKDHLIKDFYIAGTLLLLEIAKEKGGIEKSKYEEIKEIFKH